VRPAETPDGLVQARLSRWPTASSRHRRVGGGLGVAGYTGGPDPGQRVAGQLPDPFHRGVAVNGLRHMRGLAVLPQTDQALGEIQILRAQHQRAPRRHAVSMCRRNIRLS
jgi:hypothetical protein